MSLEDILAIDACPVDEEILCDISDAVASHFSHYSCYGLSREKWVRFLLFYRYIEKFILAMEIPVSLPVINYCLSKKEGSVSIEKYVEGGQSGDFARGIFTQVMTECGWQYRIVEYNGQSWVRTAETGICKSAEWKSVVKLARKMKKIIKPGRSDTKYHIFWNYQLAWYLQFRQRNPRKVELVFLEGDKKIMELLDQIGSPMNIRFEENLCMLDADKYLLGVMEGYFNGHKVNFWTVKYLFLLRIVVLDKLLKYAGKLFEKEEKS
ncbi:MAG: hypothetical protein J1E98_00305 [Lachnospiraceae bacterium]|nr:hypothetical protein [Lachnospiraceae bacterium]